MRPNCTANDYDQRLTTVVQAQFRNNAVLEGLEIQVIVNLNLSITARQRKLTFLRKYNSVSLTYDWRRKKTHRIRCTCNAIEYIKKDDKEYLKNGRTNN